MKIAGIKIAFLVFTVSSGCSVEPDSPGQCPRDCSQAVPAPSSQFTLEALSSDSKIKCEPIGADNIPQIVSLTAHFWAFKERKLLGSGADSEDKYRRAAPYISVLPIIAGGGASLTTTSEELCTDRCGAVSFSFQASCPSDPTKKSTVSVGLLSGSLASGALTVELEGAEFDSE